MPSSRAPSPATSINDQDSPKPRNVQYTQNSSSRSSSEHNKNGRQISAYNSKTIVPSLSLKSLTKSNSSNSHKQSTNHFTDVNGKPITNYQNQHTHSPTPLPEAARISHHSNSSSGRNFPLRNNSTNNSANYQNNDLNSDNESSVKEKINGRLQQDFNDCKVKLNQSQKRNSQLESEINRNQCENCAESIKQLQKEKDTAKRKIEEITKDFQLKMDKSKCSNEKLKLELNQLKNKCQTLQNENDNDKSQFSGQIGKLESIVKEKEEKNKILKKNYDKYKLKFNQSNHEKQNLTSEYQKLLSERDNLKFLVKEIDDKNKILQNNYNKSGEENENLKIQRDKYLAEINILESVLKESYTTNRRLHQDCDDCKAELQRSDERNSQLKNEIWVNNRKIEEITKKYQLKMENSNSFIEKLKLELDRLELKNKDNKCKISQENSQLETANQRSNSSESTGQLQNENARVKSKNEEFTIDCQSKMNDLNNSINNLILEFNQSKEKCTNLQSEIIQYLAEIDKLKSALKELDKTKNKLHKDCDDCKAELQRSAERNLQLENEMKINKRKIEEIKKDFQLKLDNL